MMINKSISYWGYRYFAHDIMSSYEYFNDCQNGKFYLFLLTDHTPFPHLSPIVEVLRSNVLTIEPRMFNIF